MQNFVRNLLTEWRKLALPFNDGIVIAAVSGGADSVSLLLALRELKERKKLNLRVVVAHFNHNLRGVESDADEQFVKNLANKFNFELALGKGEISGAAGNLEQNARDARYEFLFETAENLSAFAVLTAHTLNDQAETFLFNLIRGSGIEGLSAMRAVRQLDGETKRQRDDETRKSQESSQNLTFSPSHRLTVNSPLLVRPLLRWTRREDTENFCRLNKIEFRYDSMNEDLKFNRVRIRKILLPMLKDFNPKIIETLAKTAEMLRDDAEHLAFNIKNKLSEGDESKIENRSEELAVIELKDVFPSMRRFILRDWLKSNRGNLRGLELKHIEAIERLLFSGKSGRLVELPNGAAILKKGGKLLFQNAKVEK